MYESGFSLGALSFFFVNWTKYLRFTHIPGVPKVRCEIQIRYILIIVQEIYIFFSYGESISLEVFPGQTLRCVYDFVYGRLSGCSITDHKKP